MTARMIRARPWQAAQCPICDTWIYTAKGPFAEGGDRTKPFADFIHYESAHPELANRKTGANGIQTLGIPFFHGNAIPVDALFDDEWLNPERTTR